MNKNSEIAYLPLMKKMANVIAHDVRNPLNNILLSTAQFKMETPPDKEDTAFYIDIIERNCDRVNELLSDILDVLQAPALAPEDWDIAEILKELLSEREAIFELKNVQVSHQLTDMTILNCDREKLKLAFGNVIDNAAEAQREGGAIKVSATREDNGVRVVVTDNGAGITDEIMPSIFAPFFTTRDRHKGLGLAHTANIMEAHNGKIAVRSLPGGGTEVQLFLPE